VLTLGSDFADAGLDALAVPVAVGGGAIGLSLAVVSSPGDMNFYFGIFGSS